MTTVDKLAPKLLVIEEDEALGQLLTTTLSQRGFAVRIVHEGRSALDAVGLQEPDVTILDLGLPDIDGIEVCRLLRLRSQNPIVVLAADDGVDRKVAAFRHGADDYVTKPFAMSEFTARVEVAIRHYRVLASIVSDRRIAVGDVRIDVDARQVFAGTEEIDLTRTEFDLLALLARNPGKILSHAQIVGSVWSSRQRPAPVSLRGHIARLRRKLGTGPDRPALVAEVGVGYRLAVAPEGP